MASVATQSVTAVPQPPIDKYTQAAESKHELPWADLVTLDLSRFDEPGEKQRLARQLADAVHNVGFFYVGAHQHACGVVGC